NVSQGDDFLDSPSLKGIVKGTTTFEKIDLADEELTVTGENHRTKLVFTADHAFSPLTVYTAHLSDIKDHEGEEYSGYYTFSWTTGTGSIQSLPASVSTSVFNSALQATLDESSEPLTVTKITPQDHSIQNPLDLSEIVIEFNR